MLYVHLYIPIKRKVYVSCTCCHFVRRSLCDRRKSFIESNEPILLVTNLALASGFDRHWGIATNQMAPFFFLSVC